MKTLYLHGLDSFLSAPKQEILEKHTSTLLAPSIDYRANPTVIQQFIEKYEQERIELVIGSSMGGLVAYYLSWFWQIPSLVFNPALPYRSVIQELPKLPTEKPRNAWLRVVLGRHDDVIKANDTLALLLEDMPNNEPCSIHLRNDLAHQIPIPIFEEEISYFYQQVKK